MKVSVVVTAPMRFVSIAWRYCSRTDSILGAMPALLMRTSRRPWVFEIVEKAAEREKLDGGEVFSWAAGGDEGGESVRAFSFGAGAENYVVVGFGGGGEDAGCDEAETLVCSWAYG